MVGLKYTETEKETTTTPRATTRPRTLAALLPRRLLPNGPRKLVALLVVSLLAALPLALARTPSGCFCTSCSNSATVSSTRTLFAADIDTDKMDRVTIEYDVSVNDGDDPSSIAVFVSHENSGSTSYSGPGLMSTTQCVDDSVTFSAASHKSSTAYVVARCRNSFASCPVVYNIKMSYTPKSSSSSGGGTTTTTTGGGTTSTSTTTTTTSSTTASSSSSGGVLIYILAGCGLLLVIGIIVGCCCWRKHKKNKKVQAFAQKAKDFADVATTDPNFAATAATKIRELEAAVAAAKNASPGAVAGTAGAAVGASGRRPRSHRPSPPPPPRRSQAPSDVESGLAGYSDDDYDQDDDPEDKSGESVLDTVLNAVGMRRSTPSRGRGRGRGSRRY
jgi:hypothetical protein